MLSNFKQRVRPDASHTDCLEQINDPVRPSEIDNNVAPGRRSRSQSDARHPLPSSRSVIQVLYPPSYLGVPSPFPDPPPYTAQGDDAEVSPSISTGIQGTRSCSDPLAEDPSLTGVPSQGRVPSVEPNPPIISCGDNLEETEPLPAYSRSDQRRPRFPVASDVLGPYPPLSVLRQAAR